MMMEVEQKNKAAGQTSRESDDEKWVHDSSFDRKGRVPLRASTGVWKASSFIIAIEFSERLSYFAIASSLILYLTRVIHQDLKTAARSVNYWTGVTTLMPLFGGFLADAYLGRFSTVVASTIVYLLGLVLLTASSLVQSIKGCDGSTKTCRDSTKLHEIVFFLSIYMISIGTGGHKPSLESFGADQFDDDHPEERKQKMSFFNWWNFGLCSGLFFGVTVVVYVQEHVGWGVADIVLTVVMALSLVVFIAGRPFYRYRAPTGSPLTPMLQVLVAAIKKRNLPRPSNPALFHEVPKTEKVQGRFLCPTQKFKFLDKAAIIEEVKGDEKQSPWGLVTVTKVEELKLIFNMVPIWIASLPFGMIISQASTFFIKQCAIMDRKIGSFVIPPASIFAVAAMAMIITVTVYEKILVPMLKRITGNERGISILQRVGFGWSLSIVTMIICAIVEQKRLTSDEQMSVFWLAPQFIIIGIGDGFALVGLQEYFYGQAPDSMRSLGIALYLSVIGAANFLSSLLITVVDHVTAMKSGKSWFGKDLNSSRLDRFYWLLAVMGAVNLCVYVVLAKRYCYKSVQKVAVADCYEAEGDQVQVNGGEGSIV